MRIKTDIIKVKQGFVVVSYKPGMAKVYSKVFVEVFDAIKYAIKMKYAK